MSDLVKIPFTLWHSIHLMEHTKGTFLEVKGYVYMCIFFSQHHLVQIILIHCNMFYFDTVLKL